MSEYTSAGARRSGEGATPWPTMDPVERSAHFHRQLLTVLSGLIESEPTATQRLLRYLEQDDYWLARGDDEWEAARLEVVERLRTKLAARAA